MFNKFKQFRIFPYGVARAAVRSRDYGTVIVKQHTGIIPTHAEAYYYRGRSHRLLGRDEPAIGDLSNALALDDRYADAYYQRGKAQRNLGRYEKAISDFLFYDSDLTIISASHDKVWIDKCTKTFEFNK